MLLCYFCAATGDAGGADKIAPKKLNYRCGVKERLIRINFDMKLSENFNLSGGGPVGGSSGARRWRPQF